MSIDWASIGPFLALVGSAVASVLVGGPGAVAFPAPALLWCALTYSLFTTSALSLLFSFWTLLTISSGYLSIGAGYEDQHALMSIRIGVMLSRQPYAWEEYTVRQILGISITFYWLPTMLSTVRRLPDGTVSLCQLLVTQSKFIFTTLLTSGENSCRRSC